jgi:hypothetical protein
MMKLYQHLLMLFISCLGIQMCNEDDATKGYLLLFVLFVVIV